MYLYIYTYQHWLALAGGGVGGRVGAPECLSRAPAPGALADQAMAPVLCDPTPSTLHPTPYTLHPTPFTLHPTPYTLHPTLCTLNPTPCTIQSTP